MLDCERHFSATIESSNAGTFCSQLPHVISSTRLFAIGRLAGIISFSTHWRMTSPHPYIEDLTKIDIELLQNPHISCYRGITPYALRD